MPVFAYSSLGRGLFSGRTTRENYGETLDSAGRKAYAHDVNFLRLARAEELAKRLGVSIPQIALAFILNSPMNVYALVGATSREECAAAVAAQSIRLDPRERAWLDLERDTI
jgi:aryl-alcohol dehydrogenase-like predicted oxidoreductase